MDIRPDELEEGQLVNLVIDNEWRAAEVVRVTECPDGWVVDFVLDGEFIAVEFGAELELQQRVLH